MPTAESKAFCASVSFVGEMVTGLVTNGTTTGFVVVLIPAGRTEEVCVPPLTDDEDA